MRAWLWHGQIIQHPIVQRPMHLKLQRANRVTDALNTVRKTMREIVHRIEAPLIAGMMMFLMRMR